MWYNENINKNIESIGILKPISREKEKRKIMKKLLGIILVMVIAVTACGRPAKESRDGKVDEGTQKTSESKTGSQEEIKPPAEENTTPRDENEVKNNLSKDTSWNIVDELELKVDSVTLRPDKKAYVVKYTYKNTGAKSEDGKAKDLLLEPSLVLDQAENSLERVTSPSSENSPRSIKPGETCEGAELAYAVMDESHSLKIEFSYATSDGAIQGVRFEIPVE